MYKLFIDGDWFIDGAEELRFCTTTSTLFRGLGPFLSSIPPRTRRDGGMYSASCTCFV